MSDKGIGVGSCPQHGEFYQDAYDSPCPACEDNFHEHSEEMNDEG